MLHITFSLWWNNSQTGKGLESAQNSPANESRVLFVIKRSRDQNNIVYRLKKNSVKPQPIEIFWRKEQQKEALSYIQKTYAYGLKFLDQQRFTFVSYTDKELLLQKQQNRVVTDIHGQKAILQEIYLHFANQSFWFPKIAYVELRGKSLKNGSPLSELIIP